MVASAANAAAVASVEAGAIGYLLKDATRMMERMRAPDSSTPTRREIEVLELVAAGTAAVTPRWRE